MRIDEIDLYGNLLISGFTGSEGQILTYNTSGTFDWGTASGGSSGPTSSYFKTSGYNYVICETVNTGNPSTDALTNGTNLANAYDLAKTLDVGTKSATNRVVVLLMPGNYDTNTLTLDTSYVDLIGFSTNPYSTKVFSSTDYVLSYGSGVDSVLQNVYFGTANIIGLTGYGNNFLRWKNVKVYGSCFSSGVSLLTDQFGLANIYGEFEDIELLSSSCFALTTGQIDGTFKNIRTTDSIVGAFAAINGITGTFSQIYFSNSTLNVSIFQSVSGNISGYYRDIIINDITTGYSIFNTNANIDIDVENLQITGEPSNIFSSNNLYGTYRDIIFSPNSSISTTPSLFNVNAILDINIKNLYVDYSPSLVFQSGTVSGTYENITISANTPPLYASYVFYASTGDITGTFKNIEVGNLVYGFYSSYNINGTFENIKTGNVDFFFNPGLYLQGTYSNIESGDTNISFYTPGTVSGYFSDIKLGNSGAGSNGLFKGDSGLVGTFKNIEVGDAPNVNVFHSNGEVSGIFKNIKIGESTNCFQSESSNLLGTFENIEFGKAYSFAFNSFGGNVDGTFDNIKTSYSTNYFLYALNNLTGTFSNIEVPQIDQLCFNGASQLSGSFKNIKIVDLSGIDGDTFFSGSDLTGTFENIEVGNGNSSFDIFKSSGNISGTFSNIKIGDNYPQAFYAPGSISGYYKDITIGDLGSGRIFYGSEISVGTTIDNLYSITRIGGTTFKGRLINSAIIDSVNSWQLSIDVSVSPMPIVENCKLITNGGGYSILPVNGGSVTDIQVLYTATNETTFDDALADALMTPNYNIADAGLT